MTYDKARPHPTKTVTLKVCLVGPLPPPSGGMANQCEQLARLLRGEGVAVEVVQSNRPYRPSWIGALPFVRALARLPPYFLALHRAARRAQVMHVLANSGWAWHLFAFPALVVARWHRVPSIVNYRGGEADRFFAEAPRWVIGTLAATALRVAPSTYLQRVFARHGLHAEVIPNIVDAGRFTPRRERRDFGAAPHVLVARNLEAIYDIDTALRAFVAIRRHHAQATMTVAGSGPELQRLAALAAALGVADAVCFPGRVDNARMPELYACADLALNPSRVDNTPNSVLEAFASGVPVVSTRAGGVPDLVHDGVDGLLVDVGDADAMGDAALRVLGDPALAQQLAAGGLDTSARYSWPKVRDLWLGAYRRLAITPGCETGRCADA